MQRSQATKQDIERAPDLDTIIRFLMTEYADPARVLELYYWSLEPGLLDIIRGVMALPKQPRAAVQAFLAMAPNPKLVDSKIDNFGRLTLFSPQVAETLATVRDALQRDAAPAAG